MRRRIAPGGNSRGNHRGLDGDGPRTTKRIDQRYPGCPSGQQNHSRCEHFVQRSLSRACAVTAAVQRISRRIARNSATSVLDVKVDPKVRKIRSDRRTPAGASAKLVHNRVFGFQMLHSPRGGISASSRYNRRQMSGRRPDTATSRFGRSAGTAPRDFARRMMRCEQEGAGPCADGRATSTDRGANL